MTTSAKSKDGITWNISVKRMRRVSIHLPKYPARLPTTSPKVMVMSAVTAATKRVVRPPVRMPARMSRPR